MSSDPFFSQLIPQAFSSGSSFDSVSGSATAKQLDPGTPAGNQDSFERTLQRVHDTEVDSKPSKSSDADQSETVEQVGAQSEAAADAQSKRSHSDNLLGVSPENQQAGSTPNPDSAASPGLDSLTAVLRELEKIIMLANDSGPAPDSVSGQKASMLTGILEGLGATNAVDSETILAKLQALPKHAQAAGENKPAAELQNMTELFSRLSAEETQNLLKSPEMTRLVQNLTAWMQKNAGNGNLFNQTTVSTEVTSPEGNPGLQEKSAGQDIAAPSKTIAAMPNRLSANSAEPGAPQVLKPENAAQDGQLSEKTISPTILKTAVSGATATVAVSESQQNPQSGEMKTPVAGSDVQLKKSFEGAVAAENSQAVIPEKSPSARIEATLQNAKIVNVKTEGSATDAAMGKLVKADSGNKEEGFSFSSQQQNEIKTTAALSAAKETETVPNNFRAQTLDQIVQKAALHLKNGQNEIQINLKPDFLGQIRMQIITENQQVTVRIMAEFPMVKELIESNAQQLRSELQSYGMDIDELEVSVSQNPDQQVADQNKAGGSNNGSSSAAHQDGEENDEMNNPAALHAHADNHDDDANTRIDFFA